MIRKLSFILPAILLCNLIAKAQSDGGYNATVIVVGPFQPTVSDATKINITPAITDSVYEIPVLNYYINSKKIDTKFETEPIKPVKLVDEKLTKLYKYYAKAGFGTYTTPYAEVFYSNQRSRKWANSIRLKHISSTGKIKNAGFPGWSDNLAEATSTHFWKKSSLTGGINFSRNAVHYYGYNPDSVLADLGLNLSKKETKQRFIYLGAYASYANTSTDSSVLDYKFNLGYNFTGDYYKRQEHGLLLDGKISKNLELFKITKSQNIGLKAMVDNVSELFPDNSDHNSSLISLKPFINTKFGFFDINLGINATITADSSSYLYFYPDAEIHFRLIRSILDIYGGYSGNVERHSYLNLSKENQFITPDILSNFTYNKSIIYGGINTGISKNIDFYARLSKSKTDNMQFFVRDTALADTNQKWLNRFNSVYDDVDVLKVTGALVYQLREKIRLSLGGSWNDYSLDSQEHPWYKSPFEVFLSARYNIENKIIANAEVFYYAPCYGLTTGTYANSALISKKIKGYTDINLSLEYRYSKVLSGFLNFNNIGATRFEKWLDYPSRRFSFMAGITYSI